MLTARNLWETLECFCFVISILSKIKTHIKKCPKVTRLKGVNFTVSNGNCTVWKKIKTNQQQKKKVTRWFVQKKKCMQTYTLPGLAEFKKLSFRNLILIILSHIYRCIFGRVLQKIYVFLFDCGGLQENLHQDRMSMVNLGYDINYLFKMKAGGKGILKNCHFAWFRLIQEKKTFLMSLKFLANISTFNKLYTIPGSERC